MLPLLVFYKVLETQLDFYIADRFQCCDGFIYFSWSWLSEFFCMWKV